MFITNKRDLVLPDYLEIDNVKIKVVNSFKLLEYVNDKKKLLINAYSLSVGYIICHIKSKSSSSKLLFFRISTILLKINPTISNTNDFNILNIRLEQFNLNTLIHRLFYRLSIDVILELRSSFIFRHEQMLKYELRNKNNLVVPSIGKYNNYYMNSFQYFFSKFINQFLIEDLKLNEGTYNYRIKNNLNNNFVQFVT
ncbi:hypothetical protein BpHYR1_031089 [Brachionus plicatilis]|uniref:RNA-directed DNA polymerase from mobile element jockey-like n=1 Tax=Brachionus plicatilis TaxID=10195 RepID=A0A3M7RI46_BRAPC|nr:hypothetical protein BpHYR1_031089 [Brachionus plicatilis]